MLKKHGYVYKKIYHLQNKNSDIYRKVLYIDIKSWTNLLSESPHPKLPLNFDDANCSFF